MASYIGSNGVVAIDCEMVGINHAGETQMLARVSIVNELGQVVLDKYVKPQHTVSYNLSNSYKYEFHFEKIYRLSITVRRLAESERVT